jgi:hypothetical protein
LQAEFHPKAQGRVEAHVGLSKRAWFVVRAELRVPHPRGDNGVECPATLCPWTATSNVVDNCSFPRGEALIDGGAQAYHGGSPQGGTQADPALKLIPRTHVQTRLLDSVKRDTDTAVYCTQVLPRALPSGSRQ